jgi:hypothetical protein
MSKTPSKTGSAAVTNEGEVSFALYGDDFDPDLATQLIGVKPTFARRGDRPKPKQTAWKVSSGKVQGDVIDVYELSAALISMLRPYSERIGEAKQQLGLQAVLEVVLWITIDDTKPTPMIGFETDVVAFLNSIGASIDVDTYRNA